MSVHHERNRPIKRSRDGEQLSHVNGGVSEGRNMTPGKFKSNQTKTSRQEGGTMLITDKVELKAKSMTQQEEVHHMMIQDVGNRNYIIVINMYVANDIATKYKVNKILERKGELPLQIQFKLKIFFNTHYSELDRSSRPKRSKDLELCSPLQKPLIFVAAGHWK